MNEDLQFLRTVGMNPFNSLTIPLPTPEGNKCQLQGLTESIKALARDVSSKIESLGERIEALKADPSANRQPLGPIVASTPAPEVRTDILPPEVRTGSSTSRRCQKRTRPTNLRDFYGWTDHQSSNQTTTKWSSSQTTTTMTTNWSAIQNSSTCRRTQRDYYEKPSRKASPILHVNNGESVMAILGAYRLGSRRWIRW